MQQSTYQVLQQVLDYHFFSIGDTTVRTITILSFATVLAITLLVSRIVQTTLGKVLEHKESKNSKALVPLKRLTHYVVMFIGFGFALQIIGINLATLFAAGAIFAVGLGFAMQNIAQNFVSGIILMIERSIKPGDVLEVGGRVVKVMRMTIRSTVVRTRDEEDLIVPNSILIQDMVKNYTYTDSLFRLRTVVGVTYGSDMQKVYDVLHETAKAPAWKIGHKESRVLMSAFGSSSVDFEVAVWVEDPWLARIYQSELNQAIWWALKDADITIAFPQMDVHFDPPIVKSLESFSRPA